VVPNWEPSHIFKHILPRLRERGVSEAQLRTLMVENPMRYFRGEEPPAHSA
jgi:phosphotriesterase-related protein